jgi:glycine betaine/proline transport system permease protein
LVYYAKKSKWLAIGVLIGLLFIINQGLWKETIQTLVLVVYATALSMALGVPLGIWAAHKPKVWSTVQPILDLMQTMPTFVYLIPILILFGLGAAPALIVTIIFAMPAPVRMTYLGLTSIPKPMLAAIVVEGGVASGLAVHHGGADAMHHAVIVDGGDCHIDWRSFARQPGQSRVEQS